MSNVRLRWCDVWLGAATTSLLFTLGKFVIGYYLATSSIASSFGAAGSVVILLSWIYYSSCILFYGAEITKGYVRKFGSGVEPNSRAVLIDDLLPRVPQFGGRDEKVYREGSPKRNGRSE